MDTNFSNDDQIHSNNNDKKCDKPETTTSIEDVSKVVAWRKEFAVTSSGLSGVSGPIGFCVLRSSKKFVVSSTFENKVKVFNLHDGRFNKEVVFDGEEAKEGGSLCRPSDMVSLDQGGFALRDRTRVMIFNENGTFSHTVWRRSNSGSMCYGIAQDKQKLICLIENRLKTSLHFVNIKDGQTIEEILLENDIFGREKSKSKCRFLTLDDSGTIYVTDLGLNRVYIFEKIEGEEEFRYGVRIVGKGEGDGPGQFRDPAGVCVDGSGNWIVADSKNNRLCIYSPGRKWLGNVQVQPPGLVRRPSVIHLEQGSDGLELFVLCLSGKMAVVKLVPSTIGSKAKYEILKSLVLPSLFTGDNFFLTGAGDSVDKSRGFFWR